MVRVFAEGHFRNEFGYKNLSFESITSFLFVCVYSLLTATNQSKLTTRLQLLR